MAADKTYLLRINGRGNAWPNPIGQRHPFYSENNPIDYANASYSILSFSGPLHDRDHILWELLVDAGHGCIPMLLNSFNRIPDALFITHPHFDHILGVDWIAQSYYRYHNKKKYPLYATVRCWDTMVSMIPHLSQIIEFHELEYGISVVIDAAPMVTVTALPVFHGPHALGASMFFFDLTNDSGHHMKILFTGDVLTPLMKQADYEMVSGTDILVADSNNRFPYPPCNHWGICSGMVHSDKAYLVEWRASVTRDQLFAPHLLASGERPPYFNALSDSSMEDMLCTNVFDFVKRVEPRKVLIVHYGGLEDERYYFDRILTATELHQWVKSEARRIQMDAEFIIPETASIYNLSK